MWAAEESLQKDESESSLHNKVGESSCSITRGYDRCTSAQMNFLPKALFCQQSILDEVLMPHFMLEKDSAFSNRKHSNGLGSKWDVMNLIFTCNVCRESVITLSLKKP